MKKRIMEESDDIRLSDKFLIYHLRYEREYEQATEAEGAMLQNIWNWKDFYSAILNPIPYNASI